ncbi:MAG: argininosuccinate synthase domain-containing protein [Verrucomicrobiales bacterium]
MSKKIIVAYSGGLDTSVLLLWLKNYYNAEVIAYCADVGQAEELDGLEEKALNTGASKCFIGDLKDEFAKDYIFPMFQAGGGGGGGGGGGQFMRVNIGSEQVLQGRL